MYNVQKAVQQNVGRWFAYFVKHAPRVPFIIIGKDTHGHLVYLKTGPNPHYNSNTSKGGDIMSYTLFEIGPFALDSFGWKETKPPKKMATEKSGYNVSPIIVNARFSDPVTGVEKLIITNNNGKKTFLSLIS